MEKTITITMEASKDIDISINEGLNISIRKDERKINANDIFQLLDYTPGDEYVIEMVNESHLDSPVIEFFRDLLSDIVKKISDTENSSKNNSSGKSMDEIPF